MIGSKARRLGLAGALWLSTFAAGGCTLITDVDRSKIPSGSTPPQQQDSGTDAGAQEPEDSGVTPAPTDTPDAGSPEVPDATADVDSGITEPADAAVDGG